MKKKKLLITVHSQKGGVGKTLISIYLSRRMADDNDKKEKGLKTVLIDADLTGTSLVDYLRTFTVNDSAKHTLNDYFKCDPINYRSSFEDNLIKEYLWKDTKNFPENLSLLPNSSAVEDVKNILPHLFREDVTGFLEHRLTDLCWAFWNEQKQDVIVIDSPPVLQGISKTIIMLHKGLQESIEKKEVPHEDIELEHRCLFVCGPDIQGIVANFRNIDALLKKKEIEFEWITLVLNLFPYGELKGTEINLNTIPKIRAYLFNEVKEIGGFSEDSLTYFGKLFEDDKNIFIQYDNELAKSFLQFQYLYSKVESLEKFVRPIKDAYAR